MTLRAERLLSHAGPPKPLARVPAWLRRPVSGALGFAGRLATVTNSRKGEEPDAPVTAQLAIKQVAPEHLRFGTWWLTDQQGSAGISRGPPCCQL